MTAKLYDALIAPTVASALKRENRLKTRQSEPRAPAVPDA